LDIIDIHPGVCLWSSKVYDALKPRHHVLVEPDRKAYEPYIDPLLSQQGSRYRHVPLLSDLFKPSGSEYLPEQKPVTSKVTSKGSTNDSLLILANIPKLESSQARSRGSASTRNLHQYINGMLNQEKSFHHYGVVRMLAWLPDDEKAPFLPRTITDRKRFTVRLDLVARVSEIAGGAVDTMPLHQAKRQHDLTLESEQLAGQRAKVTGVWNPQNRRPPPSTPPWYQIGLGDDAYEQLRRLPNKLPWHDELLALHDAWSKGRDKIEKGPSKAKRGAGRPRSKEPEKLRLLQTKFTTVRKANIVAQEWAKRQMELDKAEIRSLTEGLMPSEMAARREAIRTKAAELHGEMEKGRKDLALLARKYIDDRRGFDQNPPLLQWDRRIAEPLLVTNDDFYPPKKMALLDIKPAPNALNQLSDFDKRTCFEYLCSSLFRNPAQAVSKDLTAVVQGGLADFAQKVPNLINPLQGGNANLDDLSTRTLPINLIVQLALALETWPFRRPIHEMIMTTGQRKPSRILEDS
jgi:mitochondrial transcription factor 1